MSIDIYAADEQHDHEIDLERWVDLARGVTVQQRFDEPSGDYRVTKYSNIQINHKISGDVFKLKTTGHTKTVKPNG